MKIQNYVESTIICLFSAPPPFWLHCLNFSENGYHREAGDKTRQFGAVVAVYLTPTVVQPKVNGFTPRVTHVFVMETRPSSLSLKKMKLGTIWTEQQGMLFTDWISQCLKTNTLLIGEKIKAFTQQMQIITDNYADWACVFSHNENITLRKKKQPLFVSNQDRFFQRYRTANKLINQSWWLCGTDVTSVSRIKNNNNTSWQAHYLRLAPNDGTNYKTMISKTT